MRLTVATCIALDFQGRPAVGSSTIPWNCHIVHTSAPTPQQVAWQAAADVASRSAEKPWQFVMGLGMGKSSSLQPELDVPTPETSARPITWSPPAADAAAATSAREDIHSRGCRTDTPITLTVHPAVRITCL